MLFTTAAAVIVRGKFVKIENLHLKEVNEKNNWSSDSIPQLNRTASNAKSRGAVHPYDVVGGAVKKVVGKAKFLQSVNGNYSVRISKTKHSPEDNKHGQ